MSSTLDGPPALRTMLNRGRMLADGVPWADIQQAEGMIDGGGDWHGYWMGRAGEYEALGREALAAGFDLSGGEWLWRACLSAHYAQFLWFHEADRREAGQHRKVALYREAAAYLRPASQRIEVPFEGATIPGYLRLPAEGHGPYPCVLLIGGLESTKEESYLFENMCLRRGLATFSFDGPGQGELFFDVKLRGDFERYTSAVVDALIERDEVDGDRLGVLGRSLGGHYAPKSAACDQRLKACVAWGACFDLEDLETMPARTREGFIYVTGIEDRDEAKRHLREAIDLSAVAAEIRCPLYVLHGALDTIFSVRQAEKFQQHATSAQLEVVLEEHGDHVCHNMSELVRPRMADWLAAHLA
jgi:2,6-dihydroxypseudooxynicotine hydrolase